MKERPILFSGSMVRAILEGRKTQTRRIIKPQPWRIVGQDVYGNVDDMIFWRFGEKREDWPTPNNCPYGQRGDRLWVRETWAKNIQGCPNGVTYRADHLNPLGDGPANPITWKPSIHMPRIASRITLEITTVRVEKLWSITEADALAEGITGPHHVGYPAFRVPEDSKPRYSSAVAAFEALWDSINSKRAPWSYNLWVWVLEFKRVAPC